MDIASKTIEEVLETYREKISTLSKDDRWRNLQYHCHYQSFWCIPDVLEGVMLAQDYFKALPSEIFVCSAPKSGTIWLKALTFAIVTRTRFNISTTPLLTNGPHDCVPFLENGFAKIPGLRETGIPLLSTHIPYTSLPKSIIDSGCKIVYICREPKDAFVSTCYFFSRLKPEDKEKPLTLEEAFELYCQGISPYGPYWGHVLGYWKASLEKPDKVLFIKYEDMMRDTEYYVKRLAEFMGYPFSLEEERSGTIQKVVELCSFQNLSNLGVNKTGKYPSKHMNIVENSFFFRKGEVGDWKNHLTPQMAIRLDKITEQKLNGSGLAFQDSR